MRLDAQVRDVGIAFGGKKRRKTIGAISKSGIVISSVVFECWRTFTKAASEVSPASGLAHVPP